MELNQIIQGDTLSVLKTLPDEFVDAIITSPPYFGLRDYRVEGQIGLEKTLDCGKQDLMRLRSDLTNEQKQRVMVWLLDNSKKQE